jgi:phage baseplate assembly protein W
MAYEVRYNSSVKTNPDVAVGIKLPLVDAGGRLFDLSYTTTDQILSNLKNLVLTRKGERIMEPYFGTDVYDSLFNNITPDVLSNIKTSISEAIDFWMPYVSITNLTATAVLAEDSKSQATEHGVTVSIEVSINGQRINQPVTFLLTSSARQIL